MGHKADFRCFGCRYEENDLAVGRGRRPGPYLRLFRCDNCHSIGSTWIEEGKTPRCSFCYHDEVKLLPDDVTLVECPKCEQRGTIVHRRDDTWE